MSDIKEMREGFRDMLNSVDEVSDSLLEAQKRFTGFAGQFAEMSSASNKHWTFISRILSGSGLWRVQNRVRALGNFFEILKMSEDKAIEGQKESIRNFAIVQKNVKNYDIILKEINKVKEEGAKLDETDLLRQSDMFKFYKAQYGEVEALRILEEQIQNAKTKNMQVIDKLSKTDLAKQKEFLGLKEEENQMALIASRGYVEVNKQLQETVDNYENQLKQRKKLLEEQMKAKEEAEMLRQLDEFIVEGLEERKRSMEQSVNLTEEQYNKYLLLGQELEKQRKDLEKSKREELRLTNMISAVESQTAQIKKDMEGDIAKGRKRMGQFSKAKESIAKTIPFTGPLMRYLKREKPLQKLAQKLSLEELKGKSKREKTQMLTNKLAKAIPLDPISKFIKVGAKLFIKLFIATIYWTLLFGLMATALIGLYKAGLFDVIYNAYVALRDGFIANKEIFMAVFTAVTAFFGALFALISTSQSGTVEEIEAQKADLVEKFTNMVTAGVTALVTLLVLLIPVLIEAFVMMMPVIFDALIIVIGVFWEMLPTMLGAVKDGFIAYFDNKYPELTGDFGAQISQALVDIFTWFNNDVYNTKAKPYIDGLIAWFAIKWGMLMIAQGINMAANMATATGVMAVLSPILVFILLITGVAAIFISLQQFLMNFGWISGPVAKALTAILAGLTMLAFLVFFFSGGWIALLGAAIISILVGAFVYFWDKIKGAIADIIPFADGGRVTTDGMQLVGEEGPELVKLPVGSTVYPNEVFRMGTTNKQVNQNNLTFNISVNGRVGASDSEIRDIASKLGRHIEQEVTKHIRTGFIGR